MRYIIISIALLMMMPGKAQRSDSTLLTALFSKNSDPVFSRVINNPDKYRLQIIYTRIDRDRQNNPSFTNYAFQDSKELYFNPASMVKMPLAFLSLEKLHSIPIKGIDKNTVVKFDSSQPWQHAMLTDSTAATSLPSMAQFIRRAFLISENDPYNRLYQFVGQGDINAALHKKGYNDVRIVRQFLGLTADQNRYTNAIKFYDKTGKWLYTQRSAINEDTIDFSNTIKLGNGYINGNDSLVNEPFDFTKQNYLPLDDMRQMLQSVLFPLSVPASQRFKLDDSDYYFLRQYLSQYPSETPYPKYDTSRFYDSYVKFFFRDSSHSMPGHVRVFNKVGWSYGFLTDVSYVVDFKNKVEFMLAATVYVNEDGILNDDKYEYESIGHPFLYQLGQTIYHYELQRKRLHKPDLAAFGLKYEKRDPGDKRPPLKEVDN